MDRISLGDCSICMEKLRAPDSKNLETSFRPTTLSCGHIFHIGCVRRLATSETIHRTQNTETTNCWLECPICRKYQNCELQPMITHVETFVESSSQVDVQTIVDESRKQAEKMKKLVEAMQRKTLEAIKCEDCGMGFNKSSEYTQHFKDVHQAPPVITCHECGRLFDSTEHFTRHWASEHGYLACDACGEILPGLKTYREHFETTHRNFDCPYCMRHFDNVHEAIDHVTTCLRVYQENTRRVRGPSNNNNSATAIAIAGSKPTALWSCDMCIDSFESEVEAARHAIEDHSARWDDFYMCDVLSCEYREGFSSRDAYCRHFIDCHTKKYE